MKFKKVTAVLLAMLMILLFCNITYSESDNTVIFVDFENYTGKGKVPEGFTEESGQLWATSKGNCSAYIDETGNHMMQIKPLANYPVWRYVLPKTLNSGRYIMTFEAMSTAMTKIRPTLYFADETQNSRYAISVRSSDYKGAEAVKKTENNQLLKYNLIIDVDNATITYWVENDIDKKNVLSVPGLKNNGFAQFFLVFWDATSSEEYILMDNLSIKSLPINMKIDNASKHVGNIFYDNEEIFIPFIITNASENDETVEFGYTAKARSGKLVGNETINVTVPANGQIAEEVKPKMDFYDTGVVTVSVKDKNGDTISDDYDFSRVLSSNKTNKKFGICTHDLTGERGNMEYRVNMLAKAGFGSVRSEMEWFRAEKSAGTYAPLSCWKPYIDNLKKYDMDYLLIAGLGNSLYDGGGMPYTESGVKAFTNYASYFTDYIKKSGHNAVEIWNEGDLMGNPSFNPASRPASDYRKLMVETAKAVRKANPNATIVGGVQANVASETWTRDVLSDGAADYIDAYSIHPYNHTTAPETGGLLDKIARMRTIIDEYNPNVDIWLTEMGYFTALQPGNEARQHTLEEQAAWAVRMYMIVENQDIAKQIYWYDYINPGTNPQDSESNYGVVKAESGVNVTYAAKPAYLSIAAMNNMILDAEHIGITNPDEKTYINRYKKTDGRDLLVLWSLDKKDSIGLKSDNSVDVYDIYGNHKGNVSPVDGVLNIQIGYEPIYVIGNIKTTEVCEPNIYADNPYLEVCEGDVFDNTITAQNVQNLELSVTEADGITIEQNNGHSDFVLKMNVGANEMTRIPIELHDSEGKIVYVGEYLIKKNDNLITTTLLAQPYDNSTQNRWCATVTLTNNTISSELSGKVRLTSPGNFAEYAKTIKFKNLGPKQTTTLKINLPELIKKNARTIAADVELDSGKIFSMSKYSSFAVAGYAENGVVIDGKKGVGEWTGTALIMDKSTWDLANNVTKGFTDENDLSANAWVMYDKENFYLFVDVKDNIFSQEYTADAIWNGDSVQIGIDDISGGAIYASEYCEVGCALTKNGPQFYRWSSVDKKGSEVKGTKCEILRDNGHTYYEMSIPWTELITKPDNVLDFYDFGFAMLVNDNDAGGRRGWCQYTTGIARGKDTSKFGRLILQKPE